MSSKQPQQVTFTVKVVQGANGWYEPKKVTCKPGTVVLKTSDATQTVVFSLRSDPGNPPGTQLWFARNQDQWGNVPGIVVKPVTTQNIRFPKSFPKGKQDAYANAVQFNVDEDIASVPSDDPRSQTSVTFDPAQIEPTDEPAFEIELPYQINYYIHVDGVSYGPVTWDPQMDIRPS